jgi:PadR family transcriptional regulator PadR
MKHSQPSVKVARALLAEPEREFWGYQLTKAVGYPSGVVYPVLGRMVKAGWLVARQEPKDVRPRPARKYLTLTEQGRTELAGWLKKVDDDPRFFSLGPDGAPR